MLRSTLSPRLRCTLWGTQPSMKASGFPQSWFTDYPGESIREDFIFLCADTLPVPSAGKQNM